MVGIGECPGIDVRRDWRPDADEDLDPAERLQVEAGEGLAEGFELAEEGLALARPRPRVPFGSGAA